MSDSDDSPIAALVAAAAVGDGSAWNELVDRYAPLLVSVVRGFRLGAAETEDVAQTVWLRLVEHLHSLREPEALPMWIITIARREAIRYLTVARRVSPYDPLEPSAVSQLPDDAKEPDEDLARAERRDALLSALAELPSRQRELLLLLVEDPPLSYAEISDRTGIPIGSIGPTRGRAVDRLRRTSALRAHQDRPDGPGHPARSGLSSRVGGG
jgi:RNA polymerase sigma factor (sigma-70 family)